MQAGGIVLVQPAVHRKAPERYKVGRPARCLVDKPCRDDLALGRPGPAAGACVPPGAQVLLGFGPAAHWGVDRLAAGVVKPAEAHQCAVGVKIQPQPAPIAGLDRHAAGRCAGCIVKPELPAFGIRAVVVEPVVVADRLGFAARQPDQAGVAHGGIGGRRLGLGPARISGGIRGVADGRPRPDPAVVGYLDLKAVGGGLAGIDGQREFCGHRPANHAVRRHAALKLAAVGQRGGLGRGSVQTQRGENLGQLGAHPLLLHVALEHRARVDRQRLGQQAVVLDRKAVGQGQVVGTVAKIAAAARILAGQNQLEQCVGQALLRGGGLRLGFQRIRHQGVAFGGGFLAVNVGGGFTV